jgi:hypothetical protein
MNSMQIGSNWDGRTRRSIPEAFGPHTSTAIHDPDTGYRMATVALYLVAGFALAFVIGILVAEFT